MKIKIIYDPLLRQVAKPVTVFDAALKKEAAEMLSTMKQYDGLGLSGNQVGLNKRLIVFGHQKRPHTKTGTEDEVEELPEIPMTALVNPEVVKFSQEKVTLTEGCLSLPELELPVTRSAGVTVRAQDLDGRLVTIKAKGLVARILQHEIDHLNGILFTDRAAEVTQLSHYRFHKIVFLGTDDFSLIVLRSLIENGLNVVSVITESTKRAGRGDAVAEPVVKKFAQELGVAIFQPATNDELTSIIRQLQPDLLVLASYGKILSSEALEVPLYGSLNVHPSMLPKYRGATPIQTAILNGDDFTGVSIMTMTPQVDAGGVVAQEKLAISAEDTALSLREKLAKLGASLLIKNLPPYLAGLAKINPQDSVQVTKTRKLTKEMGEINWHQSAVEIDRTIRAFTPWPGSFTYLGNKRLKILLAHLENGKLALDQVQLEGKRPAAWADFKRGYQTQLTTTSWYSKII